MPSSVISVMIYDPVSKILQVVFRSTGETYQYFDVPVEEWLLFRSAPSKGTYLNRDFKEKNFRYERFPKGKALRMPKGSLRWPAPSARFHCSFVRKRWKVDSEAQLAADVGTGLVLAAESRKGDA